MSLLVGARSALLQSSGLYLPSQLPGVQVWLDPADLVLNHGDPVSSWASHVGSVTFTQATGSKQPLYQVAARNGRNTVLFDGVDDFLASGAISAFDSSNQLTILAIAREVTHTGAYLCMFSFAGGFASNTSGAGVFYNSATNPQGWFRTSAGSFNAASFGTITAASWHDLALVNDGGGTGPRASLDGQFKGQTNAASGTPTTHNATYLGALLGTSSWSNIELAELVICNVAVSPSQIASLHANYFRPKFGL